MDLWFHRLNTIPPHFLCWKYVFETRPGFLIAKERLKFDFIISIALSRFDHYRTWLVMIKIHFLISLTDSWTSVNIVLWLTPWTMMIKVLNTNVAYWTMRNSWHSIDSTRITIRRRIRKISNENCSWWWNRWEIISIAENREKQSFVRCSVR